MMVFLEEVFTYSAKKFLVVSLIFAALIWLLMGGIVEQFYLYVNPETTIREVKDVSVWWKNGFAIGVFVSCWIFRLSRFKLLEK